MNVTTIKLHKRTKLALDEIKAGSETYDEFISKLISEMRNYRLKSELVAAYRSLGKKDLEMLEEWETASAKVEK